MACAKCALAMLIGFLGGFGHNNAISDLGGGEAPHFFPSLPCSEAKPKALVKT